MYGLTLLMIKGKEELNKECIAYATSYSIDLYCTTLNKNDPFVLTHSNKKVLKTFLVKINDHLKFWKENLGARTWKKDKRIEN